MELTTLAIVTFNLLYSVFTSKSGKIIRGEIADATNNTAIEVWEKIKPIFIEEDKKLLDEIKNNPEDVDYQEEFKLKIKRILRNNADLKNQIEEILKKSDQSMIQKYIIKDSKNVVTGGIKNISGNIDIGDKSK